MVIKVKHEFENQFAKNNKAYTLVKQEYNVDYKGFRYEIKYNYEKKLNFLHRFALGSLAALGKISIYFRNHKKVIKWMKQAKEGKIEKIVLVAKKQLPPQKELKGILKSPDANKPRKNVQIGENKAKVRHFDNKKPPVRVGFIKSTEFNKTDKVEPLVNDNAEEVVNLSQERRFPPRSIVDTIGKLNREPVDLFTQDDIVENSNIIRRIKIEKSNSIAQKDVYINYTKHGKAIIQQQANRSCVPTVLAMFMADAGQKIDLAKLRYTNLAKIEKEVDLLKEAGLEVVATHTRNLKELREAILKNGSCITHFGGKLGGHVVIVDEISEDLKNVRLRDPYHGWEVTVTAESFLNEWKLHPSEYNYHVKI